MAALYLAREYGTRVQWALAGRSQTKLAALKADLCDIDPALQDLPILLADSADVSALRGVARQAKVVLSTVGPFARLPPPSSTR